MNRKHIDFLVLVVDNDKDECQRFENAYGESGLPGHLYFFKEVAELLQYLERCKSSTSLRSRVSGVILLDLNLPVKPGLELLKEIKQDTKLNLIPIVIYSGSQSEVDIISSYELGANGYISKPASYTGLVDTIRGFGDYWINATVVPKCLLAKVQS